jgi:competence protein ComEA
MIRNLIVALLAALSFSAFAAVDANQASQADLETVKGIGPGLSTKILAARKTATFKDWADLVERVPGVGPGNAARFSTAGLTVAGASFQPTAAMAPADKSVKTAKAEKIDKTEKTATQPKAVK